MSTTSQLRLLSAAALVALSLLQTGSALAAPVPGCTADSLVPVSASAFDRSHYFVLHNEGPAACALPLHPRVILVEQGRTVPVRFTSEGSSFHASHVPPGGLATFALTPERTGCITADRVVAHVATTTTAVFDEPGLKVCRGTRVSVSQFRVAVPAGH